MPQGFAAGVEPDALGSGVGEGGQFVCAFGAAGEFELLCGEVELLRPEDGKKLPAGEVLHLFGDGFGFCHGCAAKCSGKVGGVLRIID